jgi:hypothetical protein
MERPTFTHEGDNVVVGDEKLTPSNTSKEHQSVKQDYTEAKSTEFPEYRDEEGQHESAIHLDTAKDIVTTVIDLDDDPTLNPWTFRTFFLGGSSQSMDGIWLFRRFHLIDCINIKQALAFLHLVPRCPRSINSSRKLSMYQLVRNHYINLEGYITLTISQCS